MRRKQSSLLEASAVAIASAFMVLAAGLILYPTITNENILTALRLSSLTTAIPFLLIFTTKPLIGVRSDLGRWLQNNHRYLWLTLTISHLIHLYQIILFYQLGQSCPLTVWLVTAPLWIIMVSFSMVELAKPRLFDHLYAGTAPRIGNLLYDLGVWYIWLVFTLAFGLGAVAHHLLFYNLPAFVLFLAGAVVYPITWRKKRIVS